MRSQLPLVFVAFALALGGCKSFSDVTGSIGGASASPTASRDEVARRYEADPADKGVALAYGRALRGAGQYAQASAVLETLALKRPEDREVLAAYGKALADAGKLSQAQGVLERAHTPEQPNWSVLSTQGSVADQLGDHEKAQSYYAAALKIRPGDPTVLSNLGLSYALSKRLTDAETTLQDAAARPGADVRVRQNLSLVLALEGKFAQAEDVARRDLPPDEASANVAAIRRTIAQSDTWSTIRRQAGAKPKA